MPLPKSVVLEKRALIHSRSSMDSSLSPSVSKILNINLFYSLIFACLKMNSSCSISDASV